MDAKWKSPGYTGFTQGEDHPVVNVSWEEAVAFCEWLTQQEKNSGKIPASAKYRLPTDHEWSCAAGIGDLEVASKTPKEKGMKIAAVYPWNGGKGTWPPPKGAGNYCGQETKGEHEGMIDGYEDGYMTTAPVGKFLANGNGLYDLGGNVWEWCESSYDGSRVASAPQVVRGGSWCDNTSRVLLSSFRLYGAPGTRSSSKGFRCVLVVSGS